VYFDNFRQNLCSASNLKNLFHKHHPKLIISFIQAIGLTDKLNGIRESLSDVTTSTWMTWSDDWSATAAYYAINQW